MKFTLALFALAAAQDSGSQAGSQSDSQAYAEPEATYAAEEPAYVAAPEVCLSPCPSHTPCLNKQTGTCSAAIYENYAPAYASYGQQAYPAQQAYSTQETGGYRRLGSGGCPDHTVDSRNLVVTKNWPLWTGFALLFIPALWWISKCLGSMREPEGKTPQGKAVALSTYLSRLTSGFICLCASLAYLTMATGHGYITRCCDGRSFYYARYIDWTITTPIMLFELGALATAFTDQQKKDTVFSTIWIIFIDILMIIAGLIGALMCGNEKWAFWGFSMLCFLPILWQLCEWNTKETIKTGADGLFAEALLKAFKNPMHLTVLLWSFYPIVWIFAEGTNNLSANGEAVAYTVLDILAKSVFGWMIVASNEEVLKTALKANM